MRRAFTLIELLVIIAIIGVMVSVGVLSLSAGKGAARVKGATRDVFAAIRHARTTALVTGQPAIITYSTVEADGEVMAKIEITSAKLFESTVDRSTVQTLTGEPLRGEGYELVHIEESKAKPANTKSGQGNRSGDAKDMAKDASDAPDAEGGDGETIEEILFAPIDADIVKGMRVKVLLGDEDLESSGAPRTSKISVFSNVDYLLDRFKSAKAEAARKAQNGDGVADESEKSDSKKAAGTDDAQEPVSVVWETNGRVDPHKVWIYADGQKPEDGLCIRIDRFGAAKVLSGDGKEDE